MDVRKSMFACAFALAVCSVPITPSFASQNTGPTVPGQCVRNGIDWTINGKCADKNCYYQGQWYEPGSTGLFVHRGAHAGQFTYCDGTTGQWVYSGIRSEGASTGRGVASSALQARR